MPKKPSTQKRQRKSATMTATTTVCSFHQTLCDDISEIKTASVLTTQTLGTAVNLLQKHDKMLYGENDPKQGLLWKWEANRVKIAILVFLLASTVGYFTGNGIFPAVVKVLLKACGLA